MDDSMKTIFRWGVIISLLIISLVPNGTQFIPMFFALLGAIAAFTNAKKDIENNEDSGKWKMVAAGILFLLFLFFSVSRILNWRSIFG